MQVKISNRPLLTELLIFLHAVTCYMIPSREWAMNVPLRKTFPENTWKCISNRIQCLMHWIFFVLEYYNSLSVNGFIYNSITFSKWQREEIDCNPALRNSITLALGNHVTQGQKPLIF